VSVCGALPCSRLLLCSVVLSNASLWRTTAGWGWLTLFGGMLPGILEGPCVGCTHGCKLCEAKWPLSACNSQVQFVKSKTASTLRLLSLFQRQLLQGKPCICFQHRDLQQLLFCGTVCCTEE
jgi:hypothetical protein